VKVSCAVCGRKMLTPYFTFNGKHYCRNHVPFGPSPASAKREPVWEPAFHGADKHWRRVHHRSKA